MSEENKPSPHSWLAHSDPPAPVTTAGKCPRCKGRTYQLGGALGNPCPDCHGTGQAAPTEKHWDDFPPFEDRTEPSGAANLSQADLEGYTHAAVASIAKPPEVANLSSEVKCPNCGRQVVHTGAHKDAFNAHDKYRCAVVTELSSEDAEKDTCPPLTEALRQIEEREGLDEETFRKWWLTSSAAATIEDRDVAKAIFIAGRATREAQMAQLTATLDYAEERYRRDEEENAKLRQELTEAKTQIMSDASEMAELKHELDNVWKPAGDLAEKYARGFEGQITALRQELAAKDAALQSAEVTLENAIRYPDWNFPVTCGGEKSLEMVKEALSTSAGSGMRTKEEWEHLVALLRRCQPLLASIWCSTSDKNPDNVLARALYDEINPIANSGVFAAFELDAARRKLEDNQ